MAYFGSEEQSKSLLQDARLILAVCNGTSPHVIKMLNVALSPSAPQYTIDMELAAFSLHDYLYSCESSKSDPGPSRLNVETTFANARHGVSDVMKQVTSGLQHIHALSQVHGNLKTTNGILPNPTFVNE